MNLCNVLNVQNEQSSPRLSGDWMYTLYRDEISHIMTLIVHTLSKTILGHSFFNYILVCYPLIRGKGQCLNST